MARPVVWRPPAGSAQAELAVIKAVRRAKLRLIERDQDRWLVERTVELAAATGGFRARASRAALEDHGRTWHAPPRPRCRIPSPAADTTGEDTEIPLWRPWPS